MRNRHYEVLVCQGCGSKNVVREDRAKTLSGDSFLCGSCTKKRNQQAKFERSLGEAKAFIKDTAVHGKHRYVLVNCSLCAQEYWARFDQWEDGQQKCWPCAHPNQQKHGKTGTDLHSRWMGIIRRTVYSKDPSHIRVYQERGITMCDEWRRDFEAFERWAIENGYKKGLLLDRIDNYKGYSPENCRWVNAKQSTENRRKAFYL